MQDAATSNPPPRDRKKLAAVVIITLVLGLFAGYLWWISGVLPVVERFPNGKPKVTGYAKRESGGDYKKTGRWTTFHPNGIKASEGMYESDQKVPETWHYWDEAGKELTGVELDH